MNPLPSQRPSIQLILAALAFLTGVIILVARFGGYLAAPPAMVGRAIETPLPAVLSTTLPLMPTDTLTATITPGTLAPAAAQVSPVATPTAMLAPPAAMPAATLFAATAAPATTPATVVTGFTPAAPVSQPATPTEVAVTPTTALSLLPTSVPSPATTTPTTSPTPTPTPSLVPTPTMSPTPTPMLSPATPTATSTVTPARQTMTATLTATPGSATPPLPTPGTRTLTLLVEGTQSQVEIFYEIGDTRIVVGNQLLLPWTLMIRVASDLDVRLTALGREEFGDLRCRITGDAVPSPGIVDYDASPYPSVECAVSGL
ncbi:MAG: hypothetical protein NZ699_08830 [Roseiflexus sp.]|nr:hypothetical protein [Roseiflexus sp.]MCS7289221.1 hypothetical protein [Roseiflexus sp.]MDW8146718.1 hypothetical protein [Roseiflexaceae bacterium]MDW8232635.1 hypothetical protein [Roseiflexaceae bacterium]